MQTFLRGEVILISTFKEGFFEIRDYDNAGKRKCYLKNQDQWDKLYDYLTGEEIKLLIDKTVGDSYIVTIM